MPRTAPNPVPDAPRATRNSVLKTAQRPIGTKAQRGAAKQAAVPEQRLNHAIFDAIAAQIVVIDAHGEVLDENESWRRSAGTAASASFADGSDANYLEACRNAAGEGREGAAQVLETISAVLDGRSEQSRVEYRSTHSDGRDQWFALTVTRLGGQAGAVLLHEDISVQRQFESEVLESSERERSQLGQELHDGLCQHLGGVALLAKTLSNALKNAQRPEAGQALDLAHLIYAAVEETRNVARGLHPVEMDEGGLAAALHDLAEQTNPRLRCEFRAQGQPAVHDNEVATNLYRIAKEAVANALRHSCAAQISIRLRRSADRLTLVIEDDGDGFSGDTSAAAGMGLRMMNYRANSIGARLTITNRPTRGASVHCSLPLPLHNGLAPSLPT